MDRRTEPRGSIQLLLIYARMEYGIRANSTIYLNDFLNDNQTSSVERSLATQKVAGLNLGWSVFR